MNLKSSISNDKSGCDLCGSEASEFVLTSPRLDGPLLCCAHCGLFFVAIAAEEPVQAQEINESEQAADEMKRLTSRARELALVEPHVEESEKKWRELTATERLTDLQKITSVTSGRLLEIGSSTGEFLLAASSSFQATGVEADEASYAVARSRGLDCFNGALFDAQFPAASFDIITLYHVIEHVPSPSRLLKEIYRILQPQGWLIIETPNIETIWYRWLGARWRQFIPDHKFFFSPHTIHRYCQDNEFAIQRLNSVGKAMSWRLFISRLGRYHQPTSRFLARCSNRLGLSDRTLQLNLGDVMRIYSRRR